MPAKPPHLAPTTEQIRPVHELLLARYGERAPNPRDALDGLILIILSQATSDLNCDRAFDSLKAAFPTWDEARLAPTQKVADAIRSGGLANQKAARIKTILDEIHAAQDNLDLGWMHRATPQECRDFMMKFHGVGPKTVACVLVFFLNKPAFPVDTHVHRIAKRLGWLRPIASADEAHRVLESAVPDEWKLNLHVNFIAHGRQVCRAQGNGGPRCHECLVREFCAFGREIGPDAPARETKSQAREPDFFVTVKAKRGAKP